MTLQLDASAAAAKTPNSSPGKWRVASVATVFSRRAAAGLDVNDEPFDEEEEAAIAALTSGASPQGGRRRGR